MSKQLIIKIGPDGIVESKTVNIKGKSCEKYIKVIEKITDSQTIDSDYTADFYNTSEQFINDEMIIKAES